MDVDNLRRKSRSPRRSVTLRPLLDDRALAAFRESTDALQCVADVPVDSYEIDLRIAAMHRALVAHQAIIKQLSQVGVPDLPDNLFDSISRAEHLGLLDPREARHLKSMNSDANAAKHGKPLPF